MFITAVLYKISVGRNKAPTTEHLKQMNNLMKTFFFISSLLVATAGYAQENNTAPKIAMGLEIDALPYLTGGYYGSLWVGHNHFRYRAIVTQITTPSFMIEDGFTNNKIQSYTAIADYFFSEGFEKWWVGSGFEYWKGQIQSERKLSTGRYDNVIFTAGGGYVWKFYQNFYLNPWLAVHCRIAGDNYADVDGLRFRPAFVTPEGSLKIGWHFGR